MRREALDNCWKSAARPRPMWCSPFTVPTYPAHTVGQLLALAARFANAAQCPADAVDKLKYLIFPLAEAESIPVTWREKDPVGAAAGNVRQG